MKSAYIGGTRGVGVRLGKEVVKLLDKEVRRLNRLNLPGPFVKHTRCSLMRHIITQYTYTTIKRS